MSHFANIDNNNTVMSVIVAEQEHIDSLEGRWIQTSYNTRSGVHYAPNSNDPDGGVALRKNYAGIGYTYDESLDAFIPPKPYSSWLLDESTCQWNAPTPYPDDGNEYIWDDATQTWVSHYGL
tara:strand:+ start:195 stop:560 length:366 start_codon:yes stop_codon:yes gene_type:complete